MKITMYELLGMVKDDKAPLKIKVNDEIYEYDEDRGYICRHIGGWTYLYENLNKGYISLNDEVEILEEEKKIPEKLSTWFSLEQDCENDNIQYANNNFKTMYEKINEICDYLKSKGDE